jgi:hypothetical protein
MAQSHDNGETRRSDTHPPPGRLNKEGQGGQGRLEFLGHERTSPSIMPRRFDRAAK